MSIGVQSFPELYTTLIGWQLYGQIWTLLTQTGLAYLPFIGIVLRNMAKPYESQETKSATATSQRRMEIDFVTTILLILFGVVPFLNLTPKVISYTPFCQADGKLQSYHPGDTQTSWDASFTVPHDVRVPLWWYAVISVAEGFTSATSSMLTCQPNYRKVVTAVNMSQINDPAIKQELQQFGKDCYIPARTQYLQETQKNSSSIQTIDVARKQYGQDDTEWFGSHGFQNTYYQHFKATQPVTGFNYDATQDINVESNRSNPPIYGTPSCDRWWNDTQNGLKAKLYKALPTNYWNEIRPFTDKEKLTEDTAKRIIQHGFEAAPGAVKAGGYSELTTNLGTWFSAVSTYPKIYAAQQSAPIIQAVLLALIYIFLPFALVFSGYKPKAFVIGAIIIFSIIFWSFIWHFISYLDSTLIQSLYGESKLDQLSANAFLVDMIIGILIIVAPLFWFSFMNSMGIAVGELLTRATTTLGAVGETAANTGTGIVKMPAKLIKLLK